MKYLVAFPITIVFEQVAINQIAMTPGSAWLATFPLTQVNGRCARSNLGNLSALIEAHEGTNVETHLDSHTRIWRDAIDTLGARRMERAVIGVVNPTPDVLFESVKSDANAESRMIDNMIRNSPGWLRNPAKLPCSLF